MSTSSKRGPISKSHDVTDTRAAVASDVGVMLIRDLECFQREVEMFPDDASLWRVVPGVTNPVGALALHVAGNLRYMVGAVLGGSGYVRDRDAEFSRRGLSREEVKAELERTKEEIEPVIGMLDDATLAAPFPGYLKGMAMPTRRFLIALEVHSAFHLGQAGYLRRIVTGDARSSHPIDTQPLSDV